MFIEIRKVGKKKKKYYLAHSFREYGKIKKIRRYLGLNLSKKQIEKIRKRAEELILKQIEDLKIIKDPFKNILSERELKQLGSLKAKGLIKIDHLSEEEWLRFSEIFSYDTNAIEGSSITKKEAIKIIEKDKWPEDATKWEISETYGVVEAVKYIRKTKVHISLNLIKKLHNIVFKNSKSFAGKLRKKGTEVVIKNRFGDIVHRGAPSTKITQLLTELVNCYNKYKNKYPALILATVIHNQFETIHPFQDGNGRVGRLLLNNILLKHNLPPVNIELKHRMEYYEALQDYQHKGNLRPMINLILKEYKNLKKQIKG